MIIFRIIPDESMTKNIGGNCLVQNRYWYEKNQQTEVTLC